MARKIASLADRLAVRIGELEAELAEWKLEAERRGLPKELMRQWNRDKAELAAAREALREIRDVIVPYPYSPQFLKEIARAHLGEDES